MHALVAGPDGPCDTWAQVRDTLCSLMPVHWDEQLLLASDYAEQMRVGIVAARSQGRGLTDTLVIQYMRAASAQVRMLCAESRSDDVDRWLGATLSLLESAATATHADGDMPLTPKKGAAAPPEMAANGSRAQVNPASTSADVKAITADAASVAEGPVEKAADGPSGADIVPEAVPPSEGHANLPALLLSFFRTGFEVLEAIKLDMANTHLSQLLESDYTLRHTIASRPNDFVVLLNASESDAPVPLGDDGGDASDLELALHDQQMHRSLVVGDLGGGMGSMGAEELHPTLRDSHLHHQLQQMHHLPEHHRGLASIDHHHGHSPIHGASVGHGAAAVLGSAAGAAGTTALGGPETTHGEMQHSSLSAGMNDLMQRRLDAYANVVDNEVGDGGRLGAHRASGRHDGGFGDDEDDDDDDDDDDDNDDDDGEEDDDIGGYDNDPQGYDSPYGLGSHQHLGSVGHDPGALSGDLGGAPEMHSELMEAVMQQWLQTPAGQSAAQEAARLELSTDEVGQFFHARMLQSLGRLRLGGAQEPSLEQMNVAVGSLPEDDEAAVQRLVALGFAREQVAEAYLACERNEMLAANFLMDHQ